MYPSFVGAEKDLEVSGKLRRGDILLFWEIISGNNVETSMPRTARASAGDVCYHAINRGNGRQKVFHTKSDLRHSWSSLERRAGDCPCA